MRPTLIPSFPSLVVFLFLRMAGSESREVIYGTWYIYILFGRLWFLIGRCNRAGNDVTSFFAPRAVVLNPGHVDRASWWTCNEPSDFLGDFLSRCLPSITSFSRLFLCKGIRCEGPRRFRGGNVTYKAQRYNELENTAHMMHGLLRADGRMKRARNHDLSRKRGHRRDGHLAVRYHI